MEPISLLIYVCVVAVVVWLIFYVLSQTPLPPVVRLVLTVVVGLILLFWLLQKFRVLT